MGEQDRSYQSGVGLDQGANLMFIREDANFKFYDSDVTGLQLKAALYTRMQDVTIGQGAVSNVLSIVNLPAGYKYVFFSMTSTMVTGSFWLTSDPAVGDELYLKVKAGSVASGGVIVSTSGCSVVGLAGLDVSGFTLNNSTNSWALAHLVCLTAGEWSVMEVQGNYVE